MAHILPSLAHAQGAVTLISGPTFWRCCHADWLNACGLWSWYNICSVPFVTCKQNIEQQKYVYARVHGRSRWPNEFSNKPSVLHSLKGKVSKIWVRDKKNNLGKVHFIRNTDAGDQFMIKISCPSGKGTDAGFLGRCNPENLLPSTVSRKESDTEKNKYWADQGFYRWRWIWCSHRDVPETIGPFLTVWHSGTSFLIQPQQTPESTQNKIK